MHSFDYNSAQIKFVVHFWLGKQYPVKAWLRVCLFITSVNDSPLSEIFEIAQKFDKFAAMVNWLKPYVDEWHSDYLVLTVNKVTIDDK